MHVRQVNDLMVPLIRNNAMGQALGGMAADAANQIFKSVKHETIQSSYTRPASSLVLSLLRQATLATSSKGIPPLAPDLQASIHELKGIPPLAPELEASIMEFKERAASWAGKRVMAFANATVCSTQAYLPDIHITLKYHRTIQLSCTGCYS